MNDGRTTREVFRQAEHGTVADVSGLVEAVPELMRKAGRRRAALAVPLTVAVLAARALPRLAALTAVVVIAAASFIAWDRGADTSKPSLDAVILGDGASGTTGDVVLDAVLDLERSDG